MLSTCFDQKRGWSYSMYSMYSWYAAGFRGSVFTSQLSFHVCEGHPPRWQIIHHAGRNRWKEGISIRLSWRIFLVDYPFIQKVISFTSQTNDPNNGGHSITTSKQCTTIREITQILPHIWLFFTSKLDNWQAPPENQGFCCFTALGPLRTLEASGWLSHAMEAAPADSPPSAAEASAKRRWGWLSLRRLGGTTQPPTRREGNVKQQNFLITWKVVILIIHDNQC